MRRRFRSVQRAPFEAAIALAAAVGSLAYLADPTPAQATAVGQTAKALLPYWIALYGVGGTLVLAGLWLISLRLELSGLCLFAAALLINAFSIANFAGARGVDAGVVYLALGAACVARGHFLLRAYRRRDEAE